MTRWVLCVILALVATSATAAQFTVSGTIPDQQNDSTCAAPVLLPIPAGILVRPHVQWTGPVAGEDSLAAAVPGGAFVFSRNVPSGTYSIRVWFSKTNNNLAGCDTTITFQAGGPPWKRPIVVR